MTGFDNDAEESSTIETTMSVAEIPAEEDDEEKKN